MRIASISFLILAAAFLTSCAPTPMPGADASVQSASDSYVVIGVVPDTVRFDIFEGSVRNGEFVSGFKWTDHWYGPVEDGFIVIKCRGGSKSAIESVAFMQSKTGIFGATFVPTGNTLVFDAPPGKVVYIASVSYHASGSGVAPHFASDIEGARTFMKKHFPLMADKLEQGTYQLMHAK